MSDEGPASLGTLLAESLPSPRDTPREGRRRTRGRLAALSFPLLLFLLTMLTTLVVGAHLASNYARHLPAFDLNLSGAFFLDLLRHPAALAAGIPFSFALLGILLAHEMGHYFACRYYGVRATYPYFLPAPTLIGTFGAFIRIKSPIASRRILFDIGVAGPLAGFVVAMPPLVAAVLASRSGPSAPSAGGITIGHPLAITLLAHLLRPAANAGPLALNPVGCGVWVGLFATALNLLPMGQLDGGHILYAVLGDRHKLFSRGFFLALLPLGLFCWPGWFLWAAILFFLGLRHPRVLIPSAPLGGGRKSLAVVAAVVFILCFLPAPILVR